MKRWVALMILCCIVMCFPLCATAIESFTIAQVYQERADDTKLHIRVESSEAVNAMETPITFDNIAEATIGTGNTPVLDVKSVRDASFEGMSYVFVLDHAMPIGSSRVKELKKGMDAWIDAMGPKDCAAILTAEDDEVRMLTDGFIGDHDALHAAVADYGNAVENAGKNMIFSAIRDAVQLAASRGGSVPQSCCIIVCSNGADTYQTLVTAEEISAQLSRENLPMYVVGYAYKAQKSALASLVTLAKNSGGWSEDATPSNDQGTIDEAFDKLRRRITAGNDITVDCSDGFVFNGATLVSLRLSEPEVLLKRTADLYLLDKDEKTQNQQTAGRTTVSPRPQQSPKDDSPSQGDASDSPEKGFTILLFGIDVPVSIAIIAVAIIVIIVIIALRNKSKRRRAVSAPPQQDNDGFGHVLPFDDSIEQPTQKGNNACETGTLVIRGSSPSETGTITIKGSYTPQLPNPNVSVSKIWLEYTIPGGKSHKREFDEPLEISIGREIGNTLTLEDPTVSRRHAVIFQEDGRVYLKNISKARDGKRNKLYVNSELVDGCIEIKNNSKIYIGMVPMTVTWTSSRAPATQESGDDTTVRELEPPKEEDKTRRAIAINVSWTIGEKTDSKIIELADKQSATIGRSPQDTVVIEDEDLTVSKHHIMLVCNGDRIIVQNASRDYGEGQNPFYYQGRRITDKIAFVDGMVVKAGKALIKIERL